MTEITQADKNRADQWLDRPSDTPARKSERDRLAHKFARHREQAITAWNTRHEDQQTVAKIVAWLRGQWKGRLQSPVFLANAIEAGEWKANFDDHPLTSNQFGDRETGNTSDKPQGENAMKIGDTVRKTKGYPFPGVVVADFTNYKGERRLVVEARHPDILGCLHIYNPDQLEVVK